MDPLTRARRSELMSRVKSSGTRPERALRKAACTLGLSPSRSSKGVQGSPDLVFRAAKVAVFVDGCFWHGCPIHARAPAGRADYWNEKLRGNKERDVRVDAALRESGWLPLRVWEHELTSLGAASEAAARVVLAVQARKN